MNHKRTAAPTPLRKNVGLYALSTGADITTLAAFPSPSEEYRAAFAARNEPFLYYYKADGGGERLFTRGEFWDLAGQAANRLAGLGLSKGDRVVHCFSENCPDDLVYRLAGSLMGCVPVTINWQADSDETILFKATVTDARLLIYDRGFEHRIENLKAALPGRAFLATEDLPAGKTGKPICPPAGQPVGYEDEKMIVFTAGTTGKPKGVRQAHRCYLANRLTFDGYFGLADAAPLDLLLVNPLHHTNSSALSDWAMRRPSAVIHLVQRYATPYWRILARAVRRKRGLLVTQLVSLHIDFLENLLATARLPLPEAELRAALRETEFLIGSAPVGPTTVKRLLKLSGRVPRVRFGSTETCLEVMAIPRDMGNEELMAAFNAGWEYRENGRDTAGYYIGRPHYPFTRVNIVEEIVPGEKGYMRPCGYGKPGYLVAQGANVMDGYVGDETATADVCQEGWYTGFRDIAFCLEGRDGKADYYWLTRDSALLIRGGANYAYEQVAATLSRFVEEEFEAKPDQFKLAVVGLRADSEHEDSCCVTIELAAEAASLAPALREDFLARAAQKVSKGCRPDYVRFAEIPVNFKGAVLVPRLKEKFAKNLKKRTRQQEQQER